MATALSTESSEVVKRPLKHKVRRAVSFKQALFASGFSNWSGRIRTGGGYYQDFFALLLVVAFSC